ncbi:MAG: MFS transporter, partial [Myxococcales bacterium]|nr:MFS transporter [Myxococcales bacterium]
MSEEGGALARFDAEVERNLPRNYAAHLVHGLLGQTGFRIIQAPTFLPTYVYQLTQNNSLVGLARACQAFGMLMTPVIGATLIERRRKVLPVVFAAGAMMRLQLLGLALAGFYLGKSANVVAICVLMGLFGFFTGMQSVTFSFLVSKIIPVARRGRLVGMRDALAGLTASLVGVVGGYLVNHNSLGNGYASVFLVAFGLTALGLSSLIMMREPASVEVMPERGLGARLRELPALLRADGNFRVYMLVRGLGVSGRMAMPYYVLYSDAQLDLSGADIGWLTGAFMLSQTCSNLLWGLVADRRGFRTVLAGALSIWIVATLGVLFASSFSIIALAFIGLGSGVGGFQMGVVNLVLEFGEMKDRPMRIALAQSAEQSVSIVAPLLGGVLAEAFSYAHVFACTIVVQVMGLVVALRHLRDPRSRAS